MDLNSIRKSYRFYAPIYNYIFGRIVGEGRREAVSRFRQKPGDRILEIGVGTGLSLPLYTPEVEVTGVDVSPEMLEIARRHFPTAKYPQVRDLVEMDAQELDYPDNHFQGSVAMHVASVTPDPQAMMREMFRVTEPGAPVLVVNHFTSSKRFFKSVESKLSPFSKKLGFHPDFSLEDFIQPLGVNPEDIQRVNLGGYWRLLEFRSPDKQHSEVPNDVSPKESKGTPSPDLRFSDTNAAT